MSHSVAPAMMAAVEDETAATACRGVEVGAAELRRVQPDQLAFP